MQSTCYKEKKMSHWKSLTLNCRQGGGHCMHGYLCINASVYNIPLCLFPFPSSALVLLLQISFTVSFFFFTSPFPLCHSSQPLYWNWGQRAVHPNPYVYVWYSWIKQKRHLTKTWVLCLETKFSSPSCHTRVRVCVFIGLGIPQYLTRKWWKSWLKRKVWGPLLRLLPSWPRPGGSLMPGWFAASVDEWMNRQMMDGWIICYAVFYFDTLEYIYKTKSLCG